MTAKVEEIDVVLDFTTVGMTALIPDNFETYLLCFIWFKDKGSTFQLTF